MELQGGSQEPLYQIMLARYYSSSLGRFMAVDPGDDTALGDPQSWNRYAYVRNNPVGASDPTGTMGKDDVYAGFGPNPLTKVGPPPGMTPTTVTTAAGVVKVGALLATPIAGALAGPPGAAAALSVARVAGNIETGAHLVQAAADPSPENIKDIGKDVLEGVAAKAVEATMAAGGLIKTAAEGIGETVATAATAFAAGMTGASQAATAQPEPRPLVITTKEAEATPVMTTHDKK